MNTQQERWDAALIYSWVHFRDLIDLSYRFLGSDPKAIILLKLNDYNRINTYIAGLGLKRCPWRFTDNGELTHVPWKSAVRVFVAAYSPQLNNALLSESLDNELILTHIDRYKWRTTRIKDHARNKAIKVEKNRLKCTRMVSLRSMSRNHDWSTVK
jgi:hypothetical protein